MNDQNDKAPNSQESQDPSSETTAQNASESSADTSKNDIDSKQGSQNSSSESSDQQRIKVGINSSGPWVDISLTKKGIQVLLMVLGIISIIVVLRSNARASD
jgi:preprotein translocase subunit SecF